MTQRKVKAPSPPEVNMRYPSEARQAVRDGAARSRERARRVALDDHVVARRQPDAAAKASLRDALLGQIKDKTPRMRVAAQHPLEGGGANELAHANRQMPDGRWRMVDGSVRGIRRDGWERCAR